MCIYIAYYPLPIAYLATSQQPCNLNIPDTLLPAVASTRAQPANIQRIHSTRTTMQ